MFNPMNLPDKTFAERSVLVIIQNVVYSAVGYKYTKSSKRGTFRNIFYSTSLSAKFSVELCFSFIARFLENTLAQFSLLL